MSATRPIRKPFLVMAVCSCGLLLSGIQRLHAQQTCDATRFLAVSSWSVFVTIDGNGSGSVIANGNEYDYSDHQSIQVGPATLTPSASDPETYTGPENVTVAINDQYKVTNLQLNTTSTSTFTANGFTALDAMGFGANLKISPLPLFCGYAFNAGNYLPASIASSGPGGTGINVWGTVNIPNMLDPPTPPQPPVAFPASGIILSGTTAFDSPPYESLVEIPSPGEIVHWTIKWTFVPNPEALDLAVTIPKYLSWRPSGGKDENDLAIVPGVLPNTLFMSAQLVDKNTQQPTDFGPDQVTFALVEVSHEPGVAMNWPAKANLKNPPPPDMSFASFDPNIPTADINPGFMLNADGTQADFFPSDPSVSNPSVDIDLLPYDWGGWATLNVTAMIGGNAIKGHLVVPGLPVDPNETNILLPNRQPNSFIPDQWKAAHNSIALPDNDDSESNPNGANGPGDGLTHYEEYRGFYLGPGCGKPRVPIVPEGTPGARCVHAEGDPTMKDFFVVNQIKDSAIEGILLFQFGSGLNVHYRGLTLNEIGVKDPNDKTAYRAINFNHSAAPHSVNEHAVILDWGSIADAGTGSGTVGTNDDPCNIPSNQCGVLPKHADHIEIDPTLLGSRITNGNVDTQLTVHVAHELSHTVDVWHHGDGIDHDEEWSFDPSTGQIMAQEMAPDDGPPLGTPIAISVFTEDQLSQSVAVGLTPFQLNLIDPNTGQPTPPKRFTVGNLACNGAVMLGGESSGDVLDYMRYDNTWAYIPKLPDVRVLAYDGKFGVDLTDHPGGTGLNDPNRKPRPRYGDANPNSPYLRGNNRSQVDVNDSHSEVQRGEFDWSVCK